MPRVVVLGCGTGVGKTRVSAALLTELARRGQACLGLKPIESGVERGPHQHFGPVPGSDADTLANAGNLRLPTTESHPLYAFPEPVSPHLAARGAKLEIDVKRVTEWVARCEQAVTPLVTSHSASWTVIETAGGTFSPLSVVAANFDLARALDPALWLLVAPDSLGVLHDLSSTLQAMRARGRTPDHVLLCAAREPDASTGSNAAELATLGITTVSATLARDDDRGIRALVDLLLG